MFELLTLLHRILLLICKYYISVAKHLESANTMFSFIWWIVGFYWISIGGQNLTHDSPQLYWYGYASFSAKFNLKTLYLPLLTSPFLSQAMYNFPGIRRVFCRYLCCCGMFGWACCLLLSTLYYCNTIRRCRSGIFFNLS